MAVCYIGTWPSLMALLPCTHTWRWPTYSEIMYIIYVLFHAMFSLVFVGLAYASLSRFCRPWVAVAGILLVLMPLTVAPGSLVGGTTHAAYTTPEKCLLVGLTLVWSSPIDRTFRRGMAIGSLLGIWQYVKFGGGVFAGGSVLSLDLLILIISRSGGTSWTRWLRASVGTTIAVLAFESARVSVAFATLPPPIALDVVWPAYTKALYDTFFQESRFPHWLGFRHFVVQLLPIIVGAVATVIAAVLILRRYRVAPPAARGPRDEPSVLLPGFFYLLGNLGYLGHVHVYMQYAWCSAWAVTPLLARSRWPMRSVLLAAYMPLLLVTIRAPLRLGGSGDAVPVSLPTGDVLYLRPYEHETLVAASRGLSLARSRGNGSVLVYPTAAGFDWAFAVPRYSRDTWHLPHYIRPYDEPALLAAANRLSGVVLLDTSERGDRFSGVSPMSRLRTDGTFSPNVVDQIEKRCPNQVRLSDRCVMLLP